MSNTQAKPSLDLNEIVKDQITTHLSSNEGVGVIGERLFYELGQVLKSAAHGFSGGIKTTDFLVRPVQFADGSALVLLNKHYNLPGVFSLMSNTFNVTGPDGTTRGARIFTVFLPNENDLSNSQFATLDEKQQAELNRQLDVLYAQNPESAAQPKLFSVYRIQSTIPGYDYEPQLEGLSDAPAEQEVKLVEPTEPAAEQAAAPQEASAQQETAEVSEPSSDTPV